jgi:flagellar biosynthesis protein FlhB
MAEKTEEPTPKRLRDARRQGNIAFSQELPAAAAFLVGTIVLGFWATRIGAEFRDLFVGSIGAIARVDGESLTSVWREPLRRSATGWLFATIPVVVGLTLAGLGLAFAQAGFGLSLEKIKPSLKRLNPGQTLKRWFSPTGLLDLVKTILKIVVVLVIGYSVISGMMESILALHRVDLPSFYRILASVAQSFVLQAGLAFALLAGFDYFLQWKRWKKGLMMTKDEVKREYREQEGDPIIKSQRKALHQELAMQQITTETRVADAVVVNPTHLAVAVKYDRDSMAAPRVTAKGAGGIAKQMLKVARKHEVPIVRDVPLAHALFAVEMGRYVPQDVYEAVAEVLLFAARLRQEARGGQAVDFERV